MYRCGNKGRFKDDVREEAAATTATDAAAKGGC